MAAKAFLSMGLFVNPHNPKKNIRTAADRNVEMFRGNGMDFITSSCKSGRLERLIDNIKTIAIKKENYDTALIPLFGTWPSFIWQAIMVFILKKLNKKVIISVHGGSIPARMDKNPKRFLNAMKKAEIIVCPSGYLFHYFKRYDLKTYLIENSVKLNEYSFYKKKIIRPRIIWMRAFHHVYNPEMAIRVGVILAKKYPDFKMVMAGKNGEMNESIHLLVSNLKLEDKIVFPGYINLEEKLELAKTYDIYICTNRIDNAPVSFIEFMALGLPIVSVNVGGIPYLIKNGKNGLLVNLDDDEAMVQEIDKLITQPELAQNIINNAYEYSRLYDDKNVIIKWQEVFNTVSLQTQLEN